MNMKKTALIFPLILCLILPVLLIGLNLVPKVYAQNTVYIRADGRVDPDTAPISTLDNITYTLTGTINESIVIQRNNIILDGAGHTVDGSGLGRGLDLTSVQNITIKNTNVVGFYYGVQLNLSSLITVTQCNVTQNAYDGVRLVQSSYNNISQNIISSNGNDGLKLLNSSSNNVIAGNTITMNNDDGIQFSDSPQNTISGNTISHNSDAGIYLLNSLATMITGNTVMNNRQGLETDSSNSNHVEGNTFNNNVLYGISLSSSQNSIFERNVINSNFDGVYAYQSLGNVFFGNEIQGNSEYGVWLDYSSNCTLSLNNITGNTQAGVYVRYSPGTIISDNTVSNSNGGISVAGSSNNFILGNTIANNNNGLALAFSSTNNHVYHNNFLNNTQQASSTSVVIWTNGLEGNYWSDYAGSDLNLNGIGDSPYATGAGNDLFPLMGMFHTFSTSLGYNVNVISNSTIDDFDYERLPGAITIVMHVSNMTSSQTMGLCRVTTPHYLMTEPYNITINDAQPNYVNYSVYDNGTDRWMYFNYNHSTLEVIIRGIETIPPEISVVSPESKAYATTDVPLIFTVNETTSWMGYSLDGQANVTILGNTTLTGLSEGSHDIIVYANDTFGNMGASATIYFSVDTLPPTVMVLSPENTTYYTSSVMLTFNVSEPVSWMGYSLDGQANATIAGNTTLSGLPNGSHSIIVYANDTAGNMGASSMTYFTIAKVPTITILSPQNVTYATADVDLTFTIDETTSWIGYSLDGQVNVTITGNTTLLGLSDDPHNVLVYANNTLGNMASSSIAYFSVDTTPPDITDVSQYPPEDNVLADEMVHVNATVTDNLGGVSTVILNYTTNNGTWFSVTMSHLVGNIWNGTIPGFPYGATVNYTIIAQDSVGNMITTGELAYTLQYNVIPEFAPYIALLLLMTASLIALASCRSKRIKI
jgi:parallel beta-helix repeat protein